MSVLELRSLVVGNHLKYLPNGRIYMVVSKVGLYCFRVLNPLCVGFTDYEYITLDNLDKWELLND